MSTYSPRLIPQAIPTNAALHFRARVLDIRIFLTPVDVKRFRDLYLYEILQRFPHSQNVRKCLHA